VTVRCSIVIPAHDGAALTARCLDALFADPPEVAFEVIVVDDGSAEPARLIPAVHASRVRTIRRAENGGFAAACNDGAAASAGDLLVFLNNDTVPCAGWLDAAVTHLARHPRAAAVGSRLLFPNGTVQHAGVVLCDDGYPRHAYAGLPAEHPAVLRSRPVQMVTAACVVVRRDAFETARGFDAGYRNGFEDADLCLRLRELGHEIHYCHTSVLYHDESATRDASAPETHASGERFRRRWAGRARADELDRYREDGLLRVSHSKGRIRLIVDPALGSAGTDGDPDALERFVLERSEQVVELLGETVRLAVASAGGRPAVPVPSAPDPEDSGISRLLARADALEAEVAALQSELAAMTADANTTRPSRYLAYRQLVRAVRDAVEDAVPAGGTVLVATCGDTALLRLGTRRAEHFPQDPAGGYAGRHPSDSDAAITELEQLRARGARHLVLPSTMRWWLDHYTVFADHLSDHHRAIHDDEACLVYALANDA
jgi:GT2 family glycosyltransferase